MSNIDEIRKRDREAIPRLGPDGDPLLRAEMDRRWLLTEFEKARTLGDRHLLESERQRERAEKTEVKVEDLQRQLAEAVGQAETAKQATREIMAERNTWARQLADMRDERDTAREETEKAREMLSIASTDRDNLHIAVDELARSWQCGGEGDFNAYHIKHCPGCNRADQLRRVIARWETT